MSDRKRNVRALQWLFVIVAFAWAANVDWVSKTEEDFPGPRKPPPRRYSRPRPQNTPAPSVPELRSFVLDPTKVHVAVDQATENLPGLMVTEIHYHPAEEGEAGEFVELTNVSTSQIDLSAWSFSEGIRFRFPENTLIGAGESRILCRDLAGFRESFGDDISVLGSFAGGLRNSGESIELSNAEGDRYLKVTFSDQRPWPVEADGSGSSLQLRGSQDPGMDPMSWHPDSPNPGHFNSANQSKTVSVYQVRHRPKKPGPDDAVSIRAQLRGMLSDLHLRVEANGIPSSIPIPLEATTGSAFYDLSIDLGAVPEGVLVRYWFEGTDPEGLERRWPDADQGIPHHAFAVVPDDGVSTLPTYDLLMQPEDLAQLHRRRRSNETVQVSLVYKGTVYDPLRMRIRGAYARNWPKKAYKIFFHPEQRFRGRSRVNLNSGWRDPAIVREILAYRIYGLVGSPTLESRLVRLNVNGQFWGLFVEVEQPDKRFLEEAGLEDAVLYKADSPDNQSDERTFVTETEYRFHYRKETKEEQPFADLMTFCEAVSRLKPNSPVWENPDVLKRFVNYLCATAIVQNWDSYNKNHYIGFEQGDPFRWFFLPWDLDRTLGDSWNWQFRETRLSPWLGTSQEPGVTGWNRVFDAALKLPKVRELYQARMQTLLTETLTEAWIEAQIAEFHRQLLPFVTRDRQKWGGEQGWENELQMMRDVLLERRRFLLENMAR